MENRTLVILAEGSFDPHRGKTALGVLRYGRDKVVAVVDSTHAGRTVGDVLGGSLAANTVPFVATLDEALRAATPPTAMLIGIAPTGGQLPDEWRRIILQALDSGLDVLSGLHTMLADDDEFAAAARRAGVAIVDYRRSPDGLHTAVARPHRPGKRIVLTVGTDCAVGKMSVSLELVRAAQRLGVDAAFVPTGQTGMMIDGWGVAVDRLISDFLQGSVEDLVAQGEERGDWVLVEGQGSLDHPAYSSVTLGLIHGSTPHAMVMVHKVGLTEHDFDHLPEVAVPLTELTDFIDIHERVAGMIAPSKVVAMALNTSLIADDDEARQAIESYAALTGLPAGDPVRFDAGHLWKEIQQAVDRLPWVSG